MTAGALDPARWQQTADPLADDTIARLLGPWTNEPPWARIADLNRQIAQWSDNTAVAAWQPPPGIAPEMGAALADYLRAGTSLPAWADAQRISRAEALFMDDGPLSCVLLFCASLPECYVVPDLAAVLHAAGQLEQHTEHRIRMTAAMIFPVMLRGGLTTPQGSGIAQVLKVRLIHATIRHLILRGEPVRALTERPVLPPLADLPGARTDLNAALFAHGWDTRADGLPCNQEELAYTLLTFSLVFLRGLRRLGIPLSRADEDAYLHTWNVVGHVLGIERSLMADRMDDAQALFARIQSAARAKPFTPDPRPALGQALMQAMERAMAFRWARPLPVLMTRHLCGATVMRELDIDARVGLLPRALFALLLGTARGIDALVRLVRPRFSLTRCFTRVLGYHLLSRLLMDQTRPLALPPRLLGQIGQTLDAWSDDPHAPRWLNALEDRLTTRGRWGTARAD
jgi:hypothetical protein